MKPVPFAYHRPASLDEVLDLLASHGSDAAVLAGGQSLVPLLNLRLARPGVVVDLAGLTPGPDGLIPGPDGMVVGATGPGPSLAGPGVDAGGAGPGARRTQVVETVRLGPLVRQAAVLADPDLALALPLLAAALPHVGHDQTRSRGTLCGSLVHGDPLAELALAALVSGAAVELTSAARGRRTVPVDEFLDLAFAPRRHPDELVTGLVVHRPPPGAGHAFVEVAHGATLGTAAARVVPLDGSRWQLVLGIGLDRNRPLAATVTTDDPAAAAADLADQLVHVAEPLDDRNGPAPYRRHLVRTLAARATAQALESADRIAGDHAPPGGGLRLGGSADPPPAVPAASAVPRPTGPAVAAGGDIGVAITVDGRPHAGSCEPRTSLADFLRDSAGVTSVRVGCEQGVCGSCTVLVDGALARACLTLAPSVEGADVVTATGLLSGAADPAPLPAAARALAGALRERFALQCGFCAPGLVVTGAAWLAGLGQDPASDSTDRPATGPGSGPLVDEAAVRRLLSGTICRCTGYDAMVRALLAVARTATD